MKNKLRSFILLTISLCFCLSACKDTPTTLEKTASDTELKSEKKKEEPIKSQLEKKTPTSSKLSSALKPNERIEFGKMYTDTVNFIRFDDNSDYWYFLVQKNKDPIQIMYHADIPINELIKGDKILIEWEMKSLQEAGDENITYVKPYLVSFKKITSTKPSDKNIKVLWRETLYDESLKTDVNTIVLNKDYQKSIAKPERAALGYVATFIGNECEWDGKTNENRSNLKCKLLSYLDLGYQCSDKHLNFLKKSFSKDTVALKKLKRCRTIPNTATVQSTFNTISMKTNTKEQTILINYEVTVINMREDNVSSYTKIDTFKYDQDQIILLNSEKIDNNSSANVTDKNNNSFVISCGSGCAMTYSESKIVSENNVKEVTFKVEMYINEKLSEKYDQTYIFNCDASNEGIQLQLKGDTNYKIEDEHPEIQEKLKSYISKLCNQ
ncbi:hypothetical protein [uncultured Aquimarina sp.]|uniref:hypothetical protein n=1 Tax=uncultured Aquimarina sp. TaxID=575652 RepID=UPI00261B4A11|nr:hypothetical protein [uncultured Aquimarina sp.]